MDSITYADVGAPQTKNKKRERTDGMEREQPNLEKLLASGICTRATYMRDESAASSVHDDLEAFPPPKSACMKVSVSTNVKRFYRNADEHSFLVRFSIETFGLRKKRSKH